MSLGVATGLVAALGGVGANAVSATVLGDGCATVVVEGASVVTVVEVLRGRRFGVVVTAAGGVVICGVADGGSGGSAVLTSAVATVEVTVDGSVTTGAGLVSAGGSKVGVADGATVTEGASEVGAATVSRTSVGLGARVTGFGGATGVVDGPTAGSANAGVNPPVSAVSEIAVPLPTQLLTPDLDKSDSSGLGSSHR